MTSGGRLLRATIAALMAASFCWQARAQNGAEGVSGAFQLPPRPVWAGEVFDLGFSWRVDWQAFGNLEGPVLWDSGAIVAEPWQAPALNILPPAPGRQQATITFRTRALAVQPGRVTLAPVRQQMVLRTGVMRTNDYERAVTQTLSVAGAPAALEVRPLPPAPPGFSQAVGRFKLSASATSAKVRVGEPVTWTLLLSGAGNWAGLQRLPARSVSRDLEVRGSPRMTETPGTTMFERSIREDVELIPRRAGRHVLAGVEMIVFDPDPGQYVRLASPQIVLEVQPAAAADGSPPAAAAGRKEQALPPLLSGEGRSMRPMSSLAWRATLAAPVVLVMAAWLLLALARARRHDPERVARRSHRRLRKTLRRLERATSAPERRRLVREWQRDAGLRWKLGRAAPVPSSFAQEDGWRRLWAEADLFLYGRSATLPDDWVARARQSWMEKGQPPAFAPATMFRRENLYPLAAAICLAIGLSAMPAPAAPGNGVEASLRQAVARHPLDWKARYNLAVTLAGAKRWEEAAGHAGVAWVQQPDAQVTRDLWTRFARQAGYLQQEGGVPLPEGRWGRFAAATAPAGWQWTIAAFALAAALGAVTALVALYARARRAVLIAGAVVMLSGLIGSGLAWASLARYGALSSRDAVVVWRSTPLRAVPVEAPVDAGTAMIAAGAAGSVDGRFLEWTRVRFGDGRRGWVRQENVIWFWKSAEAALE